MDPYIENLSAKEWEKFCAIMLRHHFTARHFWDVPDKDQGDLGLEFFANDGTLFQCYYPELDTDMKGYKKKIQKKINADLKKLKKNETKIKKLLGDILINQWVLIIPEIKSKDLIIYCNKKKKEIIKENISYIDKNNFQVKIETAESYPGGKLFAKGIYGKAIDIPIVEVTEEEKAVWQKGHSVFSDNIQRKSDTLIGQNSGKFQGQVIKKYIQIEKFLDQLREGYPDLHTKIEDSARAQVGNMRNESFLKDELNKKFVGDIIESNKDAFSKYSEYMSDTNMQSLSFGYLSKWLAECDMNFEDE